VRKAIYIASALLTALALRLYPTFLSGLPFSTDAWSPIRNAEVLMRYTPISIGNDEIFDGYNNYWPANSIFGIVFSYITGFKLMDAMAIGIPLAGALTILIFYVLAGRICGNSEITFLSTILIAVAYPYVLFTAGVTKETYANPLYVLILLIFLGCRGWRGLLLSTIASAVLVMSHHLTALITIAILVSIMLVVEAFRVRRGFTIDRFSVLLTSTLLLITILYFSLYAWNGLKITITLSNMLSAASYQVIAFISAFHFISNPKPYSRKRTFLSCLLSIILVFLIILLATEKPIVPGAPILPRHYLIYAIPFILISPLIVLGFGVIRDLGGEKYIVPIFWLTPLLGLEGYAIFGNSPLGLVLAYRALNFIWLPSAIISAFGLYKLLISRVKTSKFTVLLILLILALNSYNFYASIIIQERYLGYFWLYTNQEYVASEWITKVANQAIMGDVKASYLLNGYFNVYTSPEEGLQYLIGDRDQITLFTYRQMLRNGYVVYGGYSVDLPKNWMEKVEGLNLIYSNGQVEVYNR